MAEANDDGMQEQRVKQAIELTRDGEYEEALQLFEQNLAAMDAGSIEQKRLAAAAFSFYGLAVAKVRRQYRRGVQCCKISTKHFFLDPEHHHNMALVYLERGDRRSAVESLNAGLRLDPRNAGLNRVWNQIGRRRRAVIPFLPRNNPLNVWLGKKLRKSEV